MCATRAISRSVLVLALCLGLAGPATAQVLRANYGYGNSRIDVTRQVQSMVQPNGRLYFRVTNEVLGVRDPAPGRAKDLRIQVRESNGRARDYQFQEKGYVDIRVGFGGDSGPGSITRASYGYGNSRVDVTRQVQSMVQPNGRLYFRVTNEVLGVRDPAPGRVKDLRIQVQQTNGQRRDYQFQEKGYADIQVGGSPPNRPYPGPRGGDLP
jgi:hypothetical protein